MKDRRALMWIIGLAGLALLGLIAIQVYWIRNGLNIREANFRLAVDHVVRQVIYQLELQEVAFYLEGQTSPTSSHDQILLEMDSLRHALHEQLPKHPSMRPGSKSTSPATKGEMDYSPTKIIIIPGDNKDTLAVGGDISKTPGQDKPPGLSGQDDSITGEAWVHLKQAMIDKLLEDIMSDGQMMSLEERLTIDIIDTLLREAFEARGIGLNYIFGVYSPTRHAFILSQPGTDLDLLLQKGMVFPMFPSEQRQVPDYLLLWFPGEREAMLKQLANMTGISVLLLLVIMLTFAYSINIVLRQRKFAEMKNDFINNMTHEFKTPISTVALACEALTDMEINKSPSLYDEYIHIISDENKRLGIMAEKILQTAILEKGQVRLKLEHYDLHTIIEEVIRNIRIQVEIKDGSISTAFDAGNSLIHADRVHISNVIYNLLDNANKYTPRRPNINVSTENSGQGILVKVADNGIGISKAHQRKVFDKLYRVPMGDVHDFKGFGLGLSYVKTIVEQHGGRVGVESELNKGSEFRFYLPQQPAKA